MKRTLIAICGLILLGIAVSRGPLSRDLFAADTKQAGPPTPKIKAGDMAPDFSLKDQKGQDVSLKEFRGKKNVVLAFYVFAFTSG